ncbi:alpha/beta fold hydrolase [Kitasatospora sp. NPDC002227]|uniref:alpha/beta fold hydrolase n=1 Tax=Kitasatospora sp. NPDC002227 TaxID=3154773 RepID=UPI0033222907
MAERWAVELGGGVRLAGLAAGEPGGEPLVLLHGLGEGAAGWVPLLPALARGRRVYAVDLRGHGASSWPGEYSLELMRDDVLAWLDRAGLARVELVGHSMGGVVAYLLAALHPARISRLVLEDVPVPRPRVAVAPVRPEGDLAFDWEMVLAVRAQLDRPDPAWRELLPLITAPTLVLSGGPASHIPQSWLAELAGRIPGAALRTVPVGHLIHQDAPEEFLATVQEFLGLG